MKDHRALKCKHETPSSLKI